VLRAPQQPGAGRPSSFAKIERKALALSKLQITRVVDGEPVHAGERQDRTLFWRAVDRHPEPREPTQKNSSVGLRKPPAPFTEDKGVAHLEPPNARNQRFVGADALQRQRSGGMILVLEGPERGDRGVEDESHISTCGPRAVPRAARRA
jgi:hypothetical protein